VRLLYLTPGCFDKGGISRYSRYQIRAWREILGKENVQVLSLLGPDAESIEEHFEVDWFGGKVSIGTKVLLTARAFLGAFGRQADIVHVAHLSFSGIARAAASLVGGLSVVNVYGVEVWTHPRWHSVWGLRQADAVLSDCHWTARYMEEQGLRPPSSTRVFWDCVDLEKFSPGSPDPSVLSRYGIPDPATGVNLMTLGRMSPDAAYKGYERLLEVFIRVAPTAKSLRLIFAGRGDLVKRLGDRARDSGLGDRVFFTGMVHERDLPDVYRCAGIFSLISDRGLGTGEGIPLTPLEAAACGIPIMVGNQDGTQEAVMEGVNGHIFDPFDPEAQGKALLELVADPERRAAMGRAARVRIENEFAYPMFLEKHRQLFAELLPQIR